MQKPLAPNLSPANPVPSTGRGTPFAAGLASLGTAYVVANLVLAQANAVYIGDLLQSLHPFTVLFWSFLATSMFFLVRLAVAQGAGVLAIRRRYAAPLLVLNLASAFNWIGYYVGLRFVEPAIVSAILSSGMPLGTIVLERLVRQRRLPGAAYGAAAGIFFGTVLLVWASLSGLSGLKTVSFADTLVGLAGAAAGGASLAITIVASKQLGDRGWTASHIMAHRFYLLIAVTGVLAFTGPGLTVGTPSEAGYLAVAAVLGTTVPLWLLQRGILLSEPFTVSVLLSLAPVLTYLFQGFDDRLEWSFTSASGCAVVAMFTVYSLQIKRS